MMNRYGVLICVAFLISCGGKEFTTESFTVTGPDAGEDTESDAEIDSEPDVGKDDATPDATPDALECTGPMLDCNSIPNDGCEVNSQNDSMNCGTCNMQCSSGTCSGGLCVPEDLVVGLLNPHCLEVEGDYIYFTDDNGFYRYSISQHTSDTLLNGITTWVVSLYNGYAYLLTQNAATSNIYKVNTSTLESNIIISNLSKGYYLIVADGVLYITTQTDGVFKYSLDGSFISKVSNTVNDRTITYDDTHIYWLNEYEDKVYTQNRLTAAVTSKILPEAPCTVGGIVNNDDSLFISADNSIVKVNKATEVAEVILSGLDRPWLLFVDTLQLYWSDFNNGAIFKSDFDGSNVVQLSTFGSKANGIYVIGNYVYYSDIGSDKILRVNK